MGVNNVPGATPGLGRLRVPPAPSETLSGMSAVGCFGLLPWVPGWFWVLLDARGVLCNVFVWILFDLDVFFVYVYSVLDVYALHFHDFS